MRTSSVLAVALTATASADISPVPVFMWSPSQYFSKSGCADWEIPHVVDLTDVTGGLARLAGQQANSPFSQYLNEESTAAPEAVVAFVSSKSDFSEPSLQYLQTQLSAAQSCVSAPFTDTAGVPTSEAMVKSLPEGGAVSLDLSSNNCDSVLAQLKDQSKLFSNGVTDMILVRSSSDADASCMDRIVEEVSSQTSKKMLVVFSSDESKLISTDFEQPEVEHQRRLLAAKGEGSGEAPADPKGGIMYVNAPIMMGLFLSFMLMMFVWVGVSCLMSVDAPRRFAAENLPVVKEY